MQKSATSAKAGKPPNARGGPQKTCFVVIGFGQKTDFATGRVLNLDKTYEQLIRPAFDAVDVNCFRAIDANLTGSIDEIMYQWIYQADFVIADLSTLNANVFYELGVRHAQKPNTTIIIAESVLMTRIPFDLSSFVIHQYVHSGEKIAEEEADRFVQHLAKILRGTLAAKARNDSPVYTFLPGMKSSRYQVRDLEPPPYVSPQDRDQATIPGESSIAQLIASAETARRDKRFSVATALFQKSIDLQTAGDENAKPDSFLAQRLTLVTYKHGEQQFYQQAIDAEAFIATLNDAEAILERFCAPRITNDPETLGLAGAINKRLFDVTDNRAYLDLAINFYERGFYIRSDYYTGINVAFMYTMKANLLRDPEDAFQAIVCYGHANVIRRKVAAIVQQLIDDEDTFSKLPNSEKQWIYMTQAEAYQGLGMEPERELLAGKIQRVADEFGLDSYKAQQAKLQAAIDEFNSRIDPQAFVRQPKASVTAPNSTSKSNSTPTTSAFTDTNQPASATGRRSIVIHPDLATDKSIKSVEISCKIEYEEL